MLINNDNFQNYAFIINCSLCNILNTLYRYRRGRLVDWDVLPHMTLQVEVIDPLRHESRGSFGSAYDLALKTNTTVIMKYI